MSLVPKTCNKIQLIHDICPKKFSKVYPKIWSNGIKLFLVVVQGRIRYSKRFFCSYSYTVPFLHFFKSQFVPTAVLFSLFFAAWVHRQCCTKIKNEDVQEAGTMILLYLWFDGYTLVFNWDYTSKHSCFMVQVYILWYLIAGLGEAVRSRLINKCVWFFTNIYKIKKIKILYNLKRRK